MELLDNIFSRSVGDSHRNPLVCHLSAIEIRPSIVIYVPEPGKLTQRYSNLDLWANAGQKTVGDRS